MRSLRAIPLSLLRLAGRAIHRAGLHALVIRLSRHTPRVLVYHACEESESDCTRGLGVNTPPAMLARHLEFLTRHYNVVPLAALERGTYPERALVITFDDGYRSVYSGAFPLLRERAVPASMFIVTGVVGNGAIVWVNELCWLLHRHAGVVRETLGPLLGVSPRASVAQVVEAVRARWGDPALHAALAELRARAGIDGARVARDAKLYLTWEEVAEMAAAGMMFGSHTATHPSLRGLPADGQRDELAASRDALARRGIRPTAVAYPFGDHDATTRGLVPALGFRLALGIGGWNDTVDRCDVARVPIGGHDVPGLFAELEIVAPVKAMVKRLLARIR